MRSYLAIAASIGVSLAPACADAQSAPALSLAAQTDLRDRGLSQSAGKVALSADLSVPLTYAFSIDADASTLRNSRRHGGADVGLTIMPRYTAEHAGWEFSAGLQGNVFIGRSGTSYVEGTADISHTLGPVQATLGIAYAPSQAAIGGSNLYLDARLTAGIPGTPLTVFGGLGHTSGSSRDDPRSARLRPGGNYLDHHAGIEFARNRVAAGVRYSGTSIGANEVNLASPWTDRHYGSRIAAYLRLTP